MKAIEMMSDNPICIKQSETVMEAARLMIDRKISVLPVTDDSEQLVGVITQSDFVGKEIDIPRAMVNIKEILGQSFYARDVEQVFAEAKNTKVGEVMTKKVQTVGPDFSLDEVVRLMIDKKLKRIPVVENDKVIGVITRRNILKSFISVGEKS